MRDEKMNKISVIVPVNPFAPRLPDAKRCLSALKVDKLMDWWPGSPHVPHRDAAKVQSIQRALDWTRVAQIAAYLLQRDIEDVPDLIHKYFHQIYEPRKYDPGREWPPKVKSVIGFENSKYPDFSNILVHINGAELISYKGVRDAAHLVIDENRKDLNFTVIDGQHRINGAYFALCIVRQKDRDASYELPATIYLNLDKVGDPPRNQAQIFIDVNFYQKKVDSSLVVDLFPTSRGRDAISDRERAQDIGRKLMLEIGPLRGMIQIPGIRYGIKNVVTLSTLVSAIEGVIPPLNDAGIEGIHAHTEFIAFYLECWLRATGRISESESVELDDENVVYQGRVLVSALALIPAAIRVLREENVRNNYSENAREILIGWLRHVMRRAGLLRRDAFISKKEFKHLGFLGSGGIARFRDLLWASTRRTFDPSGLKPEEIADIAAHQRRLYS